MSLTIPENRALKNAIAIPSRAPFPGSFSVVQLEGGLLLKSSTLRAIGGRSSSVVTPDNVVLSPGEVKEIEVPIVPDQIGVVPPLEGVGGLERLEQSRTLVAQFTSDGTTGDIGVDLGSAPFLGVIQSAQIEVQENVSGTAALAIRTVSGQSLFRGAGNTQGDVLDLEPDFTPVGLFADPLFVPVSRIPVLAGEALFFVMRLASGVAAGDVRAKVSVTLQGSGEDLSRQIMLRASVAAPPPSLAVEVSPALTPVPGAPVIPDGVIGGLVRFTKWIVSASRLVRSADSPRGPRLQVSFLPDLGPEWKFRLGTFGGSIGNQVGGEVLDRFFNVQGSGADESAARVDAQEQLERRQFLTGRGSGFRRLPDSAEVQVISDLGQIDMFARNAVPPEFRAEFGFRVTFRRRFTGG